MSAFYHTVGPVCRLRPLAAALIVTFLAAMPMGAQAQQTTDPDELFQQARQLAFSGQREEARALCRKILETSPGYHDVRILLARTYAWDGSYDEARSELLIVLEATPAYTDARRAIVDVEMWSRNYDRALEQADAGLGFAPDDADLLYRRARILWNLDRVDEAVLATRHLLEVHPDHSQGRALLQTLDLAVIRTELYAGYSYEEFSDIDSWQQMSASVSRQVGFGSVIGRLNWASRFGDQSVQFEVDSYPRITRGVYAYVNYGYAGDESFFPNHRAGAEVYASLPRAMEMSAGFRFLRFSPSNTWILTGSFGFYRGNYWVSFRPYVTPGDGDASVSVSGTVRRYFGNADDYVGVRLSGGTAPEDAQNVTDLRRLSNVSVSAEWQKTLSLTVLLSVSGGYSFEELPFDRSRNRVYLTGGIRKRF